MIRKTLAFSGLAVLLLVGLIGVSAAASDAGALLPAVVGWQQVNSSGFGVRQATEVSALEVFNGQLYAGTANSTDGARIFRSPDGTTWTPASQPGFGIMHDSRPPAILDLAVFNGKLFASTGRGNGEGQIWRSLDGAVWTPMVIAGFGDPDTKDITALTVYNAMIYAGATNKTTGAQIWRSSSGDNNTWTQVAPAAPGSAPATVTGLAVYNAALYAAVESSEPAQVWYTPNGVTWTPVMTNGFGSSATTSTGGMATFAGYLYVGAGNGTTGAQLWRTNDGATWQPAINPGLGDPNNQSVEMVYVFQNQLYISVENTQTGMEIWRSTDGMAWEQANADGFGDSRNTGTNRGNTVASLRGDLYVGTLNIVDGGEVWQMRGQRAYLPSILR